MFMNSKTDITNLVDKVVRFVLVSTSHPGNIGASARAIKTMGFNRMDLISPKDFPHETAIYRSKAASDILEKAQIHKKLYDAIGDCQFVVGTSARKRKVPWPLVGPREAAEEIINLSLSGTKNIAIVFGREDHGLNNEEMGLCNLHVAIPTSEKYSSLNLSQAVQILAYEIRTQALFKSNKTFKQEWDVPLADSEEVERLINHFDEIMQDVDFYDQENPRKLLTRVRRFFKRSKMDHMEANIFRGLFSSIQKKIKK